MPHLKYRIGSSQKNWGYSTRVASTPSYMGNEREVEEGVEYACHKNLLGRQHRIVSCLKSQQWDPLHRTLVNTSRHPVSLIQRIFRLSLQLPLWHWESDHVFSIISQGRILWQPLVSQIGSTIYYAIRTVKTLRDLLLENSGPAGQKAL